METKAQARIDDQGRVWIDEIQEPALTPPPGAIFRMASIQDQVCLIPLHGLGLVGENLVYQGQAVGDLERAVERDRAEREQPILSSVEV